MVDPRLNSVHLESVPRKQAFRHARESLLSARGPQTIAAEQVAWPLKSPNTLLPDADQLHRGQSEFLLLDKHAMYPLKVGLNTIGRLPDNDVVVSDGYVSRRHCAILVHAGDGCELHDVASKNGTFVNGQRLTRPQHLNPGDEIRMCDRQFIFVNRDHIEATSDPPGSGRTQVEE